MKIDSLLLFHGLLLILGMLIISFLVSILFVYVPELIIRRINKKKNTVEKKYNVYDR